MKIFKSLIILAAALSVCPAPLATADEGTFNPVDPADPGIPPTRLTLLSEPSSGGSLSGAGRYTPGQQVRVSASPSTGFVFVNWTDAKGDVVSESRSFNIVKANAAETLTAHFAYAPTDPADPSEGKLQVYYILTTATSTGGSASGGGRYKPGTTVRLSASANTGFKFKCWTDEEGTVVSESASFNYVTEIGNRTLTAQFEFKPADPADPSDPVLSHNVTVTAGEGGTVSGATRVAEGSAFTISASPNTGYVFRRWLLDGEEYSTSRSVRVTMGKRDLHFTAEFEFKPAGPADPSMPSDKKYSFYIMSRVSVPGETIDFPVYMTTLDELRDMTFQLTFPTTLMPDLTTVEMSDKAKDYKVAATLVENGVLRFDLTEGTLAPGNSLLLNFKVTIPSDYPTGTSEDVKINQVSVTEPDGTHLTASTRNGRISVYKRGDTNGDNAVDVLDKMNLVSHIIDLETEVFIPEVSDMDGDGEFDVKDAMEVIEITINEE